MHLKIFSATLACLALLGMVSPSQAEKMTKKEKISREEKCEIKRPVIFAGLGWDSNAFHVAVARHIMEKGYGCKTDQLPGSTISLLNGLIRGDIDIMMEVWENNGIKAWEKALRDRKVINVGVNFPDSRQSWYVPRYIVEGKNAPAKGLKNVSDLSKFKDVFADPEMPGKGRFYNCVAGWTCEFINSKKFIAYGLDASFTNFRPGTGGALAATIEAHIKRKRPIFFTYWEPSSLISKIRDQIIPLEEPPYDSKTWKKMMEREHPRKATAYPPLVVSIGVSVKLATEAPMLIEFLSNYETSTTLITKELAYMRSTGSTAEETAKHFLKTKEDIWTKWVPVTVSERLSKKK